MQEVNTGKDSLRTEVQGFQIDFKGNSGAFFLPNISSSSNCKINKQMNSQFSKFDFFLTTKMVVRLGFRT